MGDKERQVEQAITFLGRDVGSGPTGRAGTPLVAPPWPQADLNGWPA